VGGCRHTAAVAATTRLSQAPEEKPVSMTRRTLVMGLSGIAALAAFGVSIGPNGLPRLSPALAQSNAEELMVAGPLGERSVGSATAPVTIIEYASMTCSHCAQFANEVFPVLKSKYIDTGKVRFIMREFPLDPLAAAGFMLARCAPEDKYFPVVDALFRSQRGWVAAADPVAALLNLAKQAGFTQESFEQCLTNQEVLDGVEWVRQRGAEKFGVNSTPTFFVNGKIQRGAPTVEEFDKILAPLLPS
jgi:protein-disulfide isomerase